MKPSRLLKEEKNQHFEIFKDSLNRCCVKGVFLRGDVQNL